jgi:exodeoxyribonuclease V gamma subunit
LAGLAEAQEYAGLGSDLPLAVVRDHLEAVFRDDGFGSGFISGAVTFCALKPMRTIPFRVIAIAGLDSDSFPRQDRPPTFDLQAADRRPGDRSLRVDDRQLFLECLLAAGDRLWISYVGRSAKDNSELAPSVCLSELLDCLDQGFRSPDAAAARQTVTVEHRLQPFSPAYYDGSDPRLFSYAAHNCPPPPDAARHGPTRFAPQLLPETEGVLVLTLSDLVNFWVHPCRHFCQRVLGLTLREAEEETEDVEPLDVNNLQKYLVNDWLVARRLRGLGASDEEVEIVSAQGQLPPADLGRAWYRKVIADLTPFVEGVGGLRFRDPVAFDLSGDDWRLSAEVSGLTDDARVQFRPADMKFKDQVRAWVTHVVLNAAAAANGLPRLTRLLAKDKEGHFRPLDDPRRVLDGLIADYREGQRAPAALFERSSPAFVRALSRHEGDEDGASTAHKAAAAGWYPNRFRPGEGDADDPYVALCFRGVMPLNDMREAFERWARRLWTPLLGHWGDGEP